MRGKFGQGKGSNPPKVNLSVNPAKERGALGVAIRFGIFVFTVSLASGFIAGLGVKKASRARINSSYHEMRTLNGGLLVKSVNPLKLKQVWTEADKKGPAYQQTLASIRKFVSKDLRIANAFIVRLNQGKVAFIVDPGPVGKRQDGRQVLQAKVGEVIDNPSSVLLSTLKTGKSNLEPAPIKNSEIDVLRSYAAILDSNNKPVAAVCLDVKSAPLAHDLEDLEDAFKVGIFGAFGFSLLLWGHFWHDCPSASGCGE